LLKARADILEASASEDVAMDYLRGILDCADSLCEEPQRFPAWRYNGKYRFVYFKKYLVFYRILDGEVVVAHVRYAGRRPFGL